MGVESDTTPFSSLLDAVAHSLFSCKAFQANNLPYVSVWPSSSLYKRGPRSETNAFVHAELTFEALLGGAPWGCGEHD